MMYDVVEVDLNTGKIRLMSENKDESSAEAIERMATMRRSTDDNFFTTVPAGKYADGDICHAL